MEPSADTTSTTSTVPVESTTTTTLVDVPPLIVRPDRIEYILATIRWMESRSTYDIPPNKGRASGAYQYIPSTWANYAGYPQAYLAPPWVQDERAAADVDAILRRFGNDVTKVPVVWYYPRALTDPALLDVVPKPEAGNRLTVREYQIRWLDALAFISSQPLPERLGVLPVGLDALSGAPPSIPIAADLSMQLAFPVLGPVTVAPPRPCSFDELDDPALPPCSDPQPVLVYGRQLQPVLAAADGVVSAVDLADARTGTVRVTITDTLGNQFRYSGLNDDTPGTDDGLAPAPLRVSGLAEVGASVRAGQVIGFLGNSDLADREPGDTYARLRLEITGPDGTPVDAQGPVVAAMFRQSCSVGIGPWSVPPHPATADAPLETLLVGAGDDAGGWAIGPTGQVTAIGQAALVHPSERCEWAPPEPYGPGAAGNTVLPEGFVEEIVVPTEVWIDAILDSAELTLAGLSRPG